MLDAQAAMGEPAQARGRHLLALKREDWPEVDRRAWDALFMVGDILDGSGPCVRWAPATREMRARSYGYWLGFLARSGLLDARHNVKERATPATINAFCESERARCSVKTASMRVLDLYVVLRGMNQDRDWEWLAKIVRRLHAHCRPSELKPRAGVTAACISRWAFEHMRAAEDREGLSEKRRALMFRDGLMLGLLIARPFRPRTFVAIEIGRHLVAERDGYLLRFATEDMKDRKAHEFPFPQNLVEPLQEYLTNHRVTLLQRQATSRLWVSALGGPLTQRGFSTHVATLTLREFGEAISPHFFRHIVATTIALEDPEHVNITASLLGHASLEMSQMHYNLASNVQATAFLQDIVADVRRDAGRKARAQRDIQANAVSRDMAD